MALAFLLDENIPARIWRAIQRHNQDQADRLDVVCVGQPHDLLFSSDDATVLLWAERRNRLLITEDKSTMATHLKAHLAEGNHCPGVFMVRPGARVPELVEFLVLVAYASEPAEWQDRIEYIP
jgi:hypothetical protein